MIRSRRYLLAFRGRLVRAAALSVPLLHGFGCSSEVLFESDGQGGNATATNSATSGPTANTGHATAQTATVGAGGAGGFTTVGPGGQGGGSVTELVCWTPVPDLGCPRLIDAPSYYGVCTPFGGYLINSWLSGPHIQPDGQCCYEIVHSQQPCGVGRPLMIEERALTARALVGDRGWGARRRVDTELADGARSTLAELYALDALFEHASVASFARVSLELMALGAPADLVAAAHRAALDEIEHARLCFALASRYRGEPVGAAPLSIPASLPLRSDLVEVAVSTFIEGCIGETLSAALAQEQAERATDPEVKAALERIAADEARHAELAWRTVAWAVRQGGSQVRDALARILPDANRHAPEVAAPADDTLEAHGRPSLAVMNEVQRRALLDVVLPCAQALLSA